MKQVKLAVSNIQTAYFLVSVSLSSNSRLSTCKQRHLLPAHCHLLHTPPTDCATHWRHSLSHICLLRLINMDACVLRNWHQSCTFTSSLKTFWNMLVICALGIRFSNFSISQIHSVGPTSNWFPCFSRTCAFRPVVLILPAFSTQVITVPHLLYLLPLSLPSWGMSKNFQ